MKPKPIHLFWSPLSHRIYATRAYREVKKADGGTYVEVTGDKFDVTDQVAAILNNNQVDFEGKIKARPQAEPEADVCHNCGHLQSDHQEDGACEGGGGCGQSCPCKKFRPSAISPQLKAES